MKLRNTIVVLAGVFTFFIATEVFALPTTASTVSIADTRAATGSYTLTDRETGNTYTSFCLESQQFFTPGVVYNVKSVENYADAGGGGATNGKDVLSDDTKWLYAAFLSNIFSDDDAIGSGKNSYLQLAIWHLEGEAGGNGDAWRTLEGYKDTTNTSWETYEKMGWDVVAVNIWRDGEPDAQSQLVGTAPVPEPATMVLFGAGLASLAAVRIRRKK